jgi:Spy/CpxP family protein refolding chaperone
MKQIRNIFLFAACLTAFAAFAQQGPPPGGGEGHGPRRGMPSVDDQLKNLSERLSLTADQQAKIKPILEDTHQQVQKLRDDESMAREDKMAKMRSIHEDSMAKVKAVLTDDQKKKFDQWQQEMQNNRRQRQQGGDSNPK